MVNPSTLVELCAGTAALTCHIFGVRTLSTYMGGKREYAEQIVKALDIQRDNIERVVLVDAGEWGLTLETVLTRQDAVCSAIEAVLSENDRELFDRWRNEPPPVNLAERAARHLYLQLRTFRGKPVSVKPGGAGWKTHGFSPEWAETKVKTSPLTNDRGWATPRPKIIERVRQFKFPVPVEARHALAEKVPARPRCVVYIDPDYVGRTSYPDTFPRHLVLDTATRWVADGSRVGVSEAEPLGPNHVVLAPRRRSRSFGANAEYLTLFGGP